MNDTLDVWRFFAHWISLDASSPRFHRAPTQEMDEPYRRSNSLVVRFWGERGLVLGWWRDTGYTEDQATLQGLGVAGHEARVSEEILVEAEELEWVWT